MPNDSSSEKPCLNCGATLKGAFCEVCGQAADVERYSPKAFSREAYHAIRKIDVTTTALTAWQLLVRPGAFVREYLSGKRIGFSNPVKFFFYAFVAEILVRTALNQAAGSDFVPQTTVDRTWVQMFDFAAAIFWGVLWRIFFPKSGLNATECAVAAIFFQAQATYIALVLLILTTPLRYFAPGAVSYLNSLDLFITIGYSYFFAASLFGDSIARTVIKQTVLVVLFLLFIILALLTMIWLGFKTT